MVWSVEIFDDEMKPAKWRTVIFKIINTVDPEVYRALQGCKQVQPVIRYITEDYKEAELKLLDMKKEGWKARITEKVLK